MILSVSPVNPIEPIHSNERYGNKLIYIQKLFIFQGSIYSVYYFELCLMFAHNLEKVIENQLIEGDRYWSTRHIRGFVCNNAEYNWIFNYFYDERNDLNNMSSHLYDLETGFYWLYTENELLFLGLRIFYFKSRYSSW
jgi:hypothetical protein